MVKWNIAWWLILLTGPGTTPQVFTFFGYGWGGGMITFLVLVHMLNATQLVRAKKDDNVPCTCTHVECYVTGLGWGGMITFLALVHMLNATQLVWGGVVMITSLALVHMLNATQLVRGGGGDDNVPCTCTHVECYATGLGWGG